MDLGTGANHASEYVEKSLTQRVPTLIHGDFTLSESSAITEYLDDVFPCTTLYPANPKEKARARQVQAWLRSDLMPIRQERSTEVVFYRKIDAPLSESGKTAAQKLFKAADALLSKGSEHLFDSWCIADTDLALMLNRLVLNGDEVPNHLERYARRQWERPSVQAWIQTKRPPL